MLEIVYHGTTREYVDYVVEKFGCYKHHYGKSIYLGDLKVAHLWSLRFGKIYGGTPVVLEVIVDKAINFQVKAGDIHPSCDEIPKECYKIFGEKEEDSEIAEEINSRQLSFPFY